MHIATRVCSSSVYKWTGILVHTSHNRTIMNLAQKYQHKSMILMMNDNLWQQVQNSSSQYSGWCCGYRKINKHAYLHTYK